LRIDQRMLGRLQISPAQHAGQTGTSDLNKRHRELGAERRTRRRTRRIDYKID
jgi:hypothetical protein